MRTGSQLPTSSQVASTTISTGLICRPIFVDLDGTLIATDLLHEAYLRVVRDQPLSLLMTPSWLQRGLAAFKQEIARRTTADPTLLPYRDELIALLVAERARGRAIVLATASPESWAQPIADHLGCFDDVIASDATHNRKSAEKLKAIQDWCQQRGHAEFDYCGDSSADRVLWQASKLAHLVGRGVRFRSELTLDGVTCQEVAPRRKASLRALLHPTAALSCWIVFLALALVRPITSLIGVQILIASGAFAASWIARSIVQRLFSIDDDRLQIHRLNPSIDKPVKRPLATGEVAIPQAIKLSMGLVAVATLLAGAFLPLNFVGILCGHVALGFASAAWWNQRRWLGRLTWIALCCLQLIGGATAIGASVPVEIGLVGMLLITIVACLL